MCQQHNKLLSYYLLLSWKVNDIKHIGYILMMIVEDPYLLWNVQDEGDSALEGVSWCFTLLGVLTPILLSYYLVVNIEPAVMTIFSLGEIPRNTIFYHPMPPMMLKQEVLLNPISRPLKQCRLFCRHFI